MVVAAAKPAYQQPSCVACVQEIGLWENNRPDMNEAGGRKDLISWRQQPSVFQTAHGRVVETNRSAALPNSRSCVETQRCARNELATRKFENDQQQKIQDFLMTVQHAGA